MILEHQLKTIEDVVARGQSLSQEMSSALLAAFHEADTAHKATVFQMAQLSGQKQQLEWERDQTLKLKNELETQVDERVLLRTAEMRDKLGDAEIRTFEVKREMREAREQSQFLRVQLAKAAYVIGQYQELLQADTPTSWWRKIGRLRSKKRALKRLDELVSFDLLDTWKSYAEEADEAEVSGLIGR